ncbi:MAG: response regulator [Acidobacteriota bacterium]
MESGLNMLIIDEDLSLYDLLKHSTILDKYNIYFSDNADDMLNVIKNNNINVIITDVEDDDEKAHLLLSELKSFDSLLDVIIVGDPLPSGKVLEMINLGAKDYLEKPLQVASIHRILKEISDKRHCGGKPFSSKNSLKKNTSFTGSSGKAPTCWRCIPSSKKSQNTFPASSSQVRRERERRWSPGPFMNWGRRSIRIS